MKSKHSRLERKYKHYHIPAGDWQLNQDEAKELERRQQVLQGLNELSQSDPGGARAIPDIVFHNISSSRQRQLAEEYPARDGQSASKGHLDYVGAIKEGLNDEEFANLENSFHAYISLPAELQQKWQSDLRASKPDSDEYKSRKEYERAHTVWTAEGLCSLKKLAEEAQAQSQSNPDHKPKKSPEPAPKSKEEFQSQHQSQQQKSEQEQPKPPAGSGGEGKGKEQSGATGEKQPEDDRQRLLRELHELGKQSDVDKNWLINATLSDNLSVDRQEQLYERHGRQRIAIEEQEDSSGVKLHHEIIPGQRSVNHGRAIMDSKSGYSDEEVRHALRIVDDFNKLSDKEKKSLIELASESAPVQGSEQSGKSYAKDRQEWASTVAKLIQEKAEDMPNSADEKKNWDSIENRRAVVRRITMLGDKESIVVQEAMAESVRREYCLAYLALLESDGKASPSLRKRRDELCDELKWTNKFLPNSDTSAISKVISNFSYEQMDELDKLVDGVAILAEKDPQGMRRLRSDVTKRREELIKEVDEIRFSDSLSSKEQFKREADLAGNFNSSIIAQTREAREAAEAVTGKSKPKQSSATSQPGSTSQPSSEANPQSKQKPKQEQPGSPTGGEKGRDTIEDRQEMAERLRTLDGESKKLIGLSMHDFEREAESDKNGAQRMVMPSAESIVDKLSETVDDLKPEQVSELNHLIDEVATLKAEDPQKLTELAKKAQQEFDEVAHDVDNWSMYHERTHDIYTEDMEEHIKKRFRNYLKAGLRGEFISASWRLPVHPPSGSSESPSEGGLAGEKEISSETNPDSKQQGAKPQSQPQSEPKSKGEFQSQQQKSEQEQPEPPTWGEGKGEERHSAEGEKQPEDDRQRLLREMHELGGRGEMLVADTMIDRLPLSGGEELHNLRGYQGVSFVREDADDGSTSHYRAIPGTKYIMNDYAIADEECFSDELVDLGLRVVDDLHRIPENRRDSAIEMALRYRPAQGEDQSTEDYNKERTRWSTWVADEMSQRAKEAASDQEVDELSIKEIDGFREFASGYIQEHIPPKTPNSELLVQGFFYPLGSERLEGLIRRCSDDKSSSFDVMVKSIKEYDGLNSRECAKLHEFLTDLDCLRDGVVTEQSASLRQDDGSERNDEAKSIIRSDIFTEGIKQIKDLKDAHASPDEIDKAVASFGNELQGLMHQRAERLRLCNEYLKSDSATQDLMRNLMEVSKLDRYDEISGLGRGEELESEVERGPGGDLCGALMNRLNINLLTDDEVKEWRKDLAMVKGLSKDSMEYLSGVLNDPESCDDRVIPPDVKEDLEETGEIDPETPEEIRAYNQAREKLYQAVMDEIGDLMQTDKQVEQTRDLRREYYRYDNHVRDAVERLAEKGIFDRYDELSGRERGGELEEDTRGKERKERLSDILMEKDNIRFLTDDEIDAYRNNLDLVKNLSTEHLEELVDFYNSFDDPDGPVPPDVKEVIEKYDSIDVDYPETPEEMRACNQAEEKLYQMLLEKANSLRATEEEDRAKGMELARKLFGRDINPLARQLVVGELVMKSMSKERYQTLVDAFGQGESEYGVSQISFVKFMLRQDKSNEDKTDGRGMNQEEYAYTSEMLELVSKLSEKQLKQLVESEDVSKTAINGNNSEDESFWELRQQYSKDLEQKIRQMVETEENDPMLSMVGVDRSRIVEMKAYIDAKRKLDEEMTFKPENFAAKDLNAEGKPKLLAKLRHAVVARFWKGKVMRNYYEYKYRKELKEQYSKDFTHTLGAETDGSSMSSAETEHALIWRMTQDSDFFTKTLGEKREQLSPDSEAYKRMYQAVKTFVENGDEAAFTEESRRINHDLMGNEGAPVLDNYLTSAIYIKGLVDHDRSFDDVMKGFKMYRGVSAEGVNSGHHEQAIDKLVAKFERRNADNKLSWIPPEWVAGAAGIAGWLGGAIARSRAVQAFSFGGSAALAGAMASAKESERFKIDRADLARRLAEGGKVDEDNDYETKLAETLPEMRTAESYMNAIDLAIASGDIDQIRQALADVVVAREVGRNEGIDLIDYYSGGGDAEATKNELMSRQFDLEVAYINANSDPDLTLQKFKSRLIDGLNVASHAYSARFRTVEGDLFQQSNLSEDVQEQINEVYAAQEARDKIADKFRRKRMGAEFAKTAARTLAVSIGAQEIAAFFRSDLQGALEHAFGHDDAPGTTRTLLGGFLPTPNGNAANEVMASGARPEKQFYREDEINHEQIKQWQAEGYKVDKHFDYEPHGGQGTVSAEEAVRNNVTVHRSGWADNLTERIDGNELAGHHTDIATQYAFQPSGGATGMGFAISRSEIFDAGQDGQVELWLSPTRGTQANPFKIIGHVVDNQIVFDAEPGSEAAEMLANKSYAFAEVVHAKSGFVMSTEVGSGTATSFAHQAVEYVREQTGWDVIPPVDQIVSPAPASTPDVEIPVPIPPIFRQARNARRGLSTDEKLRQVDTAEAGSEARQELGRVLSQTQMKVVADRQWLKRRLDDLRQDDKYGARLVESVMANSLPISLIDKLPGTSQRISFSKKEAEDGSSRVIPGEPIISTDEAILSDKGYPPETIAMGLSVARSLRKLNKISDGDRESELKQILRGQPKKGEWLPDVEDNSHESDEEFEKRHIEWAVDTVDKLASLASPKRQRKHNFWKRYHKLKDEMRDAMIRDHGTGKGFDELNIFTPMSVLERSLLAYFRGLDDDDEPDFSDFLERFQEGEYTDGVEPQDFSSEFFPHFGSLIAYEAINGAE